VETTPLLDPGVAVDVVLADSIDVLVGVGVILAVRIGDIKIKDIVLPKPRRYTSRIQP